MTTMHKRERRNSVNDWLDRAATADQVIGYVLVAVGICGIIYLAIERVMS